MIKTRFAPSPTGFLHVGALRAALFEYLFARSSGGIFLMRIEDTDRQRFVEGGIENFLHSLAWAGIVPDEGVALDSNGAVAQKGENGPYIQSERLAIYSDNVRVLLESGDAYYCFCGKERLDTLREQQQNNGQPTGYDEHCRTIAREDAADRAAREEHVVRMKIPAEGNTSFEDLIRGNVSFDNALVDDQVIMKSDGFPTYHLANVVDDHLMEVTHVIRGEEWLSSTPKHIVLYNAFGWEAPAFAHLPLLVNEKKQKLSKRQGDVTVEDYKEKGYLAEALVNFSAFLGWNPGDARELFTLSELERVFSLEKVGKSPSVFNIEKLDWYNKQYLMNLPLPEVAVRARPFFEQAGYSGLSDERLEAVVQLECGRAPTLRELVANVGYIFAETLSFDAHLLVWKKSTAQDAQSKLSELADFLSTIDNWSRQELEAKAGEWIAEQRYDVGAVLWPMRVALSGQKNSPGPYEIAAVLGKETTLARLRNAASLLA